MNVMYKKVRSWCEVTAQITGGSSFYCEDVDFDGGDESSSQSPFWNVTKAAKVDETVEAGTGQGLHRPLFGST